MEEIEKELLSEETVISDDDEYNLEYFNNKEYINFDNQEWNYDINPNESINQIFQGSETSSLVGESTVWLYFNKDPPSPPGFNICKRCSFKYKLTTSVTTLRRYLEKHQINVPTKKYTKVVKNKNQDPFEKKQQEEHDNCLIQCHTGINISNEIMRVLQEFNISNRIIALTTDNKSAMVVCGCEIASSFDNKFSMITFSHYRCAGHVLNLEVKQGLRLVDATVIKNSTYYMLKCFIELEPALNLLVADDELIKFLCPINSKWTAIKDTILLLEPLEKATRYLSGISYPTMEEVRLVYIEIQSHLKRFEENDNNTQREVAKVISSKIDEYWEIIDKNSIISAILDPRNKLEIFTDETNARQHIQTIYEIYGGPHSKTRG
ncbi:hypothetical protein RclHR1_01220010 [Rhizophagus clarus]|uniref:hAT-like transposase RNase-H fold domain-containing protein n=1 Tax=Rhizophagus clarus TaxID=94130 RepID=A0A2Z6QLJ9_9GLOM|nr:hypothetical protein RclHR1_01220010 [Rhizophagus clarus]